MVPFQSYAVDNTNTVRQQGSQAKRIGLILNSILSLFYYKCYIHRSIQNIRLKYSLISTTIRLPISERSEEKFEDSVKIVMNKNFY